MKFVKVAVVAAMLLGTVVMAQAAVADEGDCPSNRICLWDDGGYTGGIKILEQSTPHMADFNDRMASWKNSFSDRDARWFEGINYTDDSYCMNSDSKESYTGWWDSNELSSVQIYTDTKAC